MAVFTCRFSAQLDSKGRITVPVRIRDKLGLESGDRVSLSLNAGKVVRKDFGSLSKALEFLSGLDGVKEFSFSSGTLEVVVDG